MKVVLLGKNGMLGSCFLKYLAGDQDFEMYAFDHDGLDLTSLSDLESSFRRISPDFVINCAAYTNVDGCEDNREEAFKVNAEAVGRLASVCRDSDAVLVQFSTDYVFSGDNSDGYKEEDETGPLNVYGESKLGGEKLLAANTENYYIVRTSWLYGEKGKNFVDTMLGLAKDRDELDVVTDQIGSPTYSFDLCRAVVEQFLRPYLADVPEHHQSSMSKNLEFGRKLPFGIYHLTNSGSCSWNQFAKKIFELSGMEVKVNDVDSTAFPRPARRPKCSILHNSKCDSLRPWEEGLQAYLDLRK